MILDWTLDEMHAQTWLGSTGAWSPTRCTKKGLDESDTPNKNTFSFFGYVKKR